MLLLLQATSAAVEYTGEFAPSPTLGRDATSLNGSWQFQPQAVPAGWVPDKGMPPELAPPTAAGWEETPIKIPSPWNVNTWGAGREVGKGTNHPYWPDSVFFPSYPAAWDQVKMGWLRRTFTVPPAWKGRRIILHFEAVAGDCQVLVNGKPAGTHFDKYLPFDLDLTDLIQQGENELLVGVRSHELFNQRSERYGKMIAPYPTGSETARLAGIWQDVSLLGLPETRVQDVFVKPRVEVGVLELEVTVRNDAKEARTVELGGNVAIWVNHSEQTPVIPDGEYGPPILELDQREITVPASGSATLNLSLPVDGKLKAWSPVHPNLHCVNLSLLKRENHLGKQIDQRSTRFGWREFKLKGEDLYLNGEKIQLTGDLLHPFSPLIMSRRHVWAWYKLVKDFGGNAVRPHAQIHPRHYLELADEMGLVVLDETALFGSSVALNFEEPVAWQRFADHVDGLVLRDRNHPSVLGWSFGNELFAIFQLNNVPAAQADEWYAKLAELGERARKLDPTREWISCDGDEDLRGKLPVWSKHFGHGDSTGHLPKEADKPMMVGESGGSYYARPSQLAMFNGERAFESYAGRNEALAIDLYDNVVHLAKPHLAYFSASETAWFGVEHLNFGYRDFGRLPTKEDGVFFTKPFEEGKPGMQIERIPPYVDTLNPGWDPGLPLYKPLAMFEAMKAALVEPQPAASPWSSRKKDAARAAENPSPAIDSPGFIGNPDMPLAKRLGDLGIKLQQGASAFTVIDGDSPAANYAELLGNLQKSGGDAFLFLNAPKALPAPLQLTERSATMLVPDQAHPVSRSFGLADLYFAEDGADRFIMSHGIGGNLPEGSKVILKGSDTDWSLFNGAPEFAKCAAVLLYEKLEKPSGVALVEIPWGKGRLFVCSLNYQIATPAADAMWRKLFANLGVKVGAPANRGIVAFDREGVLVNAVSAGRFPAASLEEALAKDFVAEATVKPLAGEAGWQAIESPSRDRFQLAELKQEGPKEGAFATYFSFWLRSPRALDNLLADGPDAPRFTMHCYVSDDCRLIVNGKAHEALRHEEADYRQLVTFDGIPLKKGWNHCMIKVAADQLEGAEPGTLAVRIASSQAEYLRQLDSAIEVKAEK